MKIAIYSHSIAPSIDGVCRRFTAIFNELVRLGHELLIFTLEDSPQDLPSSAVVVTLDHMFMPTYPGKKVAQPNFESFYRMCLAINKFKPEVVHITADANSNMFALVCHVLSIPVVGSFHTDLVDLLATHHAFEFQKWAIMLLEIVDTLVLDSCATTSVSFAKKLSEQGVICRHIVHTSVDIDKFNPNKRNMKVHNQMTFGDANGFLCVYIGRISREKRLDVIIEALKPLENVYLAIIGDGPSANHYAQMHGKLNRIYCTPAFLSHDELAEIYASSDLHVSASEFETLGNTVLEAFACSIPVVVPRTQGFCDTVTHAHNGFLFDPGDSSSARLYISQLVKDKDLRLQMGIRARQQVLSRSIEQVVLDLLTWYGRGMHACNSKTVLGWWGRFFLLVVFIPFIFLNLFGYQTMVCIFYRFLYVL